MAKSDEEKREILLKCKKNLESSNYKKSFKAEEKLMKLAAKSYIPASLLLQKLYREGNILEKDDFLADMYEIMAAVSGDYETCWNMYMSGKNVDFETYLDSGYLSSDGREIKYLDYDPLMIALTIDQETTIERLTDYAEKGDAFSMLSLAEAYDRLGDAATSKAWRGKAFKTRDPRVVSKLFVNNFELTEYGISNRIRIKSPYLRSTLALKNPSPDAMAVISIMYYCGIQVEADAAKSFEYALRSAEAGNEIGMRLVKYYVGGSMSSDNEINPLIIDMSADYEVPSESESGIVYPGPNRGIIENCIEWAILSTLADVDDDAVTYVDPDSHESISFENDVFKVVIYSEKMCNANFVFKPLSFELKWQDYFFRGAECNESLSCGELKHLFRLCIDSIREGWKDSKSGVSVSEYLKDHPFSVFVPEPKDEARVARILAVAPNDVVSRKCDYEAIYFDE